MEKAKGQLLSRLCTVWLCAFLGNLLCVLMASTQRKATQRNAGVARGKVLLGKLKPAGMEAYRS
jgi:hypothetical protein